MERLGIRHENASRVRERCITMEGLGNQNGRGRLRKVLDAHSSLPESGATAEEEEEEDVKTKARALQEEPRPDRRFDVEAEALLSQYDLKPISAEGGGHCIFGAAISRFYASHRSRRQPSRIRINAAHSSTCRSRRSYWPAGICR